MKEYTVHRTLRALALTALIAASACSEGGRRTSRNYLPREAYVTCPPLPRESVCFALASLRSPS
jgi:hypothetical protein